MRMNISQVLGERGRGIPPTFSFQDPNAANTQIHTGTNIGQDGYLVKEVGTSVLRPKPAPWRKYIFMS